MPVEFDPAWEYFVPAEDADAETVSFADIDLEGRRDERHGSNVGFRFGRGEASLRAVPNRLAKPKPERASLASRPCKGCGNPFAPDRSSRLYCSQGCVPRSPDTGKKHCAGCGMAFRPRSCWQRYCSAGCRPKPGPGPRLDWERIGALFAAGVGTSAIAAEVGTTPRHVRKVLTKLGHPPRKPGRRNG